MLPKELLFQINVVRACTFILKDYVSFYIKKVGTSFAFKQIINYLSGSFFKTLSSIFSSSYKEDIAFK